MGNGPSEGVSLPKIQQHAEDIESGRSVYKRFSPQEQRGLREGGRIHEEASLVAGRNVGPRETQDGRADRQEAEVEGFARKRGVWHDNTEDFLTEKYGEPINSGNESIVFDNGATVIKTSNINQYRDLQDALDSITLHNTYFPETNIKVLGFGMDEEDGFQIITEQPYIIEGDKRALQLEIDDYLQKLGFERAIRLGVEGRYKNDNVLLNDLTPKNVIFTPVGNIDPIDTIMHLNTDVWGEGGKRMHKTI